jgi:hypothetical protein
VISNTPFGGASAASASEVKRLASNSVVEAENFMLIFLVFKAIRPRARGIAMASKL